MNNFEPAEYLAVAAVALVKFGIPIAATVWIIQALRRIRSENSEIKAKIAVIEQLLRHNSKTDSHV
jgi:hypothetical protein